MLLQILEVVSQRSLEKSLICTNWQISLRSTCSRLFVEKILDAARAEAGTSA